jgi:hypothetical protein
MMMGGICRPPKEEPVCVDLEVSAVLLHSTSFLEGSGIPDDWRSEQDDLENLDEPDR